MLRNELLAVPGITRDLKAGVRMQNSEVKRLILDPGCWLPNTTKAELGKPMLDASCSVLDILNLQTRIQKVELVRSGSDELRITLASLKLPADNYEFRNIA